MLLRFDKEANRRARFRWKRRQMAGLEAGASAVEKDRLLIGSDPAGIYEFERLDKK